MYTEPCQHGLSLLGSQGLVSQHSSKLPDNTDWLNACGLTENVMLGLGSVNAKDLSLMSVIYVLCRSRV